MGLRGTFARGHRAPCERARASLVPEVTLLTYALDPRCSRERNSTTSSSFLHRINVNCEPIYSTVGRARRATAGPLRPLNSCYVGRGTIKSYRPSSPSCLADEDVHYRSRFSAFRETRLIPPWSSRRREIDARVDLRGRRRAPSVVLYR